MFFKNPKTFIVRFFLTLAFFGGALGATQVQASPLRDSAGPFRQAVTSPVLVTVQDTDGVPMAGLNVYAFNGATYTGFHGVTDSNGQVSLLLPEGAYRFRADLNGTQFWSGTSNHCEVPGCESTSVIVSKPVTVTVVDTDDAPESGLNVYAFNGSTYTGYSKVTNADGLAVFTLPLGSYSFRADLNSTQFWSGTSNHCEIPGCASASITVSKPVTVTVVDTDGAPKSGLNLYAFNGSTYTGYGKTTNADGQAIFTLPLGSYRFHADLNGTQFWSGASNHCDIPGCDSVSVTVSKPVMVTVLDTDEASKAGLNVYAFNGSTYTSYSKATNTDGLAIFTLPLGSYRFRADLNGTQFWSEASDHCDIPGCADASVIVTIPVTVIVRGGDGALKSGVNVYAFNGSTYTGYSKVSDANGHVLFTLPPGSYRFRADYSGTQYWSGATNHCSLPGCLNASVTVGPPMTATPLPTSTLHSTPTATLTPIVASCNSIRDYFLALPPPPPYALVIPSDYTMYLAIPNPNPYPVEIGSIFVIWNGASGHRVNPAKKQELRLMKVELNGTIWEIAAPGQGGSSMTIIAPFSTPAVIPPGGATLTFTFDKTYNNPLNNGTELVTLQFSTPGCEAYPITVTRPQLLP